MESIYSLFEAFYALPEVEAVALGGSRAGSDYDASSDYDVYVYWTKPIDIEVRREILGRYCSYMEIDNRFWEPEDDCILKNGVDIELIYRDLDAFTAEVASVVEHHNPHNGYTTCMWYNLEKSRILFDRNGRLAETVQRFRVAYPEDLKSNVMQRNLQLLCGSLPAYRRQLEKAVKRGDIVSINHRSAAFMESYFDVLFALNGQMHPGEKRLVSICKRNCSILPADFEACLDALFGDLYTRPEKVAEDLSRILKNLKDILPGEFQNLIPE